MRFLPRFNPEQIKELEQAWQQKHDERSRRRLQVLWLVAQHKLTAAEIAQAAGTSRPTVFNYVRKFTDGGVAGLLETGYARRPTRGRIDATTFALMSEKLENGDFLCAKEVQEWLREQGVTIALSTVFYWLNKISSFHGFTHRNRLKKFSLYPPG